MFSLTYAFFLYISFIFINNRVSSDEVPAIMWNIHGNSMTIKPVSALKQDDDTFDASFKEVLKAKANILIFAINRLSLEDMSSEETLSSPNSTLQNLQTFLETQRYMLLSSVKQPLSRAHEVHCGVQEIVVDQSINDNVLQSISLAFDRSCVVILHISDSSIVGVKDPKLADIKRVFQPPLKGTVKDVVGIFTALHSSWGPSNDEHHRMRNLLATDESDGSFMNFTNCLILYAENASLTIKSENLTMSLPLPPSNLKGSKCGNDSAILQMNFHPSGEYTSVVLKLNFTDTGGYWIAGGSVDATGGKKEFFKPLIASGLEAPMGFSFSCGHYEFKSQNSTDVTVSFERFQVQPFRVDGKFSESFDCVTWFTVPIWMGIFVSILFIAIINCGVYALFSVHTMDRFDDPKGKTISVAAASD